MKQEETLSIINQSNLGKLPRLPFLPGKEAVLGKDYELSIVFVKSSVSKRLNNSYRGKNNPTNILSFPYGKKSGEIIIDPAVAKKDAPNFDMTEHAFLIFLLIHGMLHLKGMQHGSTMERKEKLFLKKFVRA